MKRDKSSRNVSLRDIAAEAGVSKSTVGYVLQNHPRVGATTRERVWKVARRLGYVPNPHVASWMATVRESASKQLGTLAWPISHREQNAWHRYKFLSPYLVGARARALELGYQIVEFWSYEPGMTMRRLAQIIYQRGIDGVILTHHARHFRLRWEKIAAVCLEGDLLVPVLPKIATDLNFNFLLALRTVRRMGYQRIGVCLELHVDRKSQHGISRTAQLDYATSTSPSPIPPIFYKWSVDRFYIEEERIVEWIRTHKPEVIIGHSNELVKWVNAAKLRVPEDVGVVHLAIDDDVLDWAGIYSNRRAIGAVAAETVIAAIRNRQFGIPKYDVSTLIRGTWSDGKTLSRKKRD